MEQQLYRRAQAAEILGMSTDMLDDLAGKGHIKRSKINTVTMYHKDELQRFADELMKKGRILL